ncbi:helix-turn-helix domain-containing protein [Paenibacillus wynnii]|uniref:DNA-binding protein n=1 Tax=Paenibacillus wynnii TaxID=268407 RepID=A0A098M8R5_9BACL|nr:helix-turn-helix domain-containing protein [Paenibacillus wynnii]KGE18443.1 DNA-binding protein [Paenibacillus wynnii]KGE20653.1 DNA-binding protein [Paenibacillus wynnii]
MSSLQVDDLPPVLKVEDIQKFLQIGKNQAYDLCNSGQFHVVRVGRSIKIPREPFISWFKGDTAEGKQGK